MDTLCVGCGSRVSWAVGYASQRTRDWASIMQEQLKQSAKTSRNSSLAMKCLAGATVRLRNIFALAPIARSLLKPANITFEQAGSVGVAGITALQGLRDKGHVQAGQKVLINGASGGVGDFRSANCKISWRGSDRRLQLAQHRSCEIVRRRSRDRLHERRFHQGRPALRRYFRQRAESHVFRAAARFNSKWHLRSSASVERAGTRTR